MRVAVTVQHPGHVHFFKHAIDELEARGHEVHVFAREKEMAVRLLELYGIEHEVLAGESHGLASLAAVQATYELRLLRRARELNPDVIAAIGGVAAAHVAPLVGARSVVFYDTEHATIIKNLAYPFAHTVCTPSCYVGDIGPKQVRYPGYHELAYLHPDRFTPDPTVRSDLGLDEGDSFVVTRFNDWGSSHDMGQSGFDDVGEVVDRLSETGAKVFVTAEMELSNDIEGHRLDLSPERMHDLLYYADCYVGEGATTAAECAMLGTPAVYVNSLSLGYVSELADEYGLVYSCNGPDRHRNALSHAVDILEGRGGGADAWRARRDRLLSERVDVTDVIVDQVESAGGGSDSRQKLTA
ncbi:DUF354 domain-containing protein [Haloprofundus halobius]|uniref:DUF354 domain-containing protein n=1 Tax=Haloprofundus halobius TaxID=2876194 RepID=UPI001CCC1F55|nr:DUF354 domain-containing protein [Haloprofundus halobius]